MTVDNDTYKEILSKWVSGVTVVTTFDGDEWKGTTVSSFASVSLNPPLILICLQKSLHTHHLVTTNQVFAVNILTDEQIELGKIFADMYPEIEKRFAGLDCTTSVTGSPLLPDTLAWLDCKVVYSYDGGDHTIFVGEVLAGGAQTESIPLAYFNRHWGHFQKLDES